MYKANAGKLYLIPTVIAPDTHEQTLPAAVQAKFAQLKYFLVENVRTARRFLSTLDAGIVIDHLQFEVLNKRTSPEELQRMFIPLLQGHDVGVMSEAGCPGVADPGALAVAHAHQHGFQVSPLVGPSSILLALMASGFSGQSFVFHGYLPIDKQQRVKTVRKLEKSALEQQQTQIFMETPYRNHQLLDVILRTCHHQTRLCIARELTGPQEMVLTKSMSEWKSQKPDLHKIPTVFLIG